MPAARWSSQLSIGPTGSSDASTGWSENIWAVTETAPTRASRSRSSSRLARPIAARMARTSCSTHPGAGVLRP